MMFLVTYSVYYYSRTIGLLSFMMLSFMKVERAGRNARRSLCRRIIYYVSRRDREKIGGDINHYNYYNYRWSTHMIN